MQRGKGWECKHKRCVDQVYNGNVYAHIGLQKLRNTATDL